MWKVILSEPMDRQVITKPPVDGFKTEREAELWVLKTYGSTAIDSIINGVDMGCHIVEE